MKKFFKSTILILFSVAVSLLCAVMFGCASYLDVFKEHYIEWYTENGICGFTSTLSDSSAYGYCTINGITVRAYFEVAPTSKISFEFPYDEKLNIATEYGGMSYDTSTGYCGGSISGYRDGNTFHVKSCKAGFTELGPFDMHSRKVSSTKVNSRDYTDCTWTSTDEDIVISDIMIKIDTWLGKVSGDGEYGPIHFQWCEDNRFEIYNGVDGEQDCNLLARGIYTNFETSLSLLFNEDFAFGFEGRTINLTGKIT